MTAAGILLDDGRRIWADTGDLRLEPLARVRVRFAGVAVDGSVFLAPDLVVMGSARPAGRIVEVLAEPTPGDGSDYLPGADMPPLGATVRWRDRDMVVWQIDPVARQVVLRDGDETITTSVEEMDS